MSENAHQTEIMEKCSVIIHEEIAESGFQVIRVLLFGSRVRGDARTDSDWDFFVSVDRDISFPAKAAISARILTRLAENGIDADLVIKTEGRLHQEQDNVGSITHYAMKEGVTL